MMAAGENHVFKHSGCEKYIIAEMLSRYSVGTVKRKK